jgi:hypothetical protein
MDINFWEAVVILGGIWLVVNVMKGGRWNKERMRWERHSPDNPYVKSGQLPPAEDLRARRELEDLRARVATLEKLATDPARRLEREIEALRKRDAPDA